MDGMKKQSILFALEVFVEFLKEANVLIGLNVNKKDANKSTIIFVDVAEFEKGKIDGIKIEPDSLNSWFGNGD